MKQQHFHYAKSIRKTDIKLFTKIFGELSNLVKNYFKILICKKQNLPLMANKFIFKQIFWEIIKFQYDEIILQSIFK